jgi:AcrR family transcriptional regulator
MNQPHLVKSREKLLQAFLAILDEEKQLRPLSVKKITDRAKINRITFYRQFKDIRDFIKWFILKDFVLKYADSIPFNFEYAFLKAYQHIQDHRPHYQKIINSTYGLTVLGLMREEIYSYQMSNFNRIDAEHILGDLERVTQSHFYASGITELIKQYIFNERLETIRLNEYVSYSLRLVKGYVERAIRRKKDGEYNQFVPVG